MCNKYVINVNNANNHENTQRSMRNSYVSANPPWRSHTPWVSCRDQRSHRSLPAEGPSRSESQRQSSDTRQQQPTRALQDAAIYLDDQVNIWRGVGDGKDGGPGQGGGIHVRSVRLQESFKLLRVEIIVKVLRYLQGRGARIQSQAFHQDWFSVVMLCHLHHYLQYLHSYCSTPVPSSTGSISSLLDWPLLHTTLIQTVRSLAGIMHMQRLPNWWPRL